MSPGSSGGSLQTRRAADSLTTMTEIVLPPHANALGTVFGGQILAWMDICAAVCAQRHTHATVVTAGIDELSFDRPIRVGQVVRLQARVTAVFRTSMEIEVIVEGEDPMLGERWPCVSAFLTFVAIDRAGGRLPIAPLEITSEEEARLQQAAQQRRAERLSRREQRPSRSHPSQ